MNYYHLVHWFIEHRNVPRDVFELNLEKISKEFVKPLSSGNFRETVLQLFGLIGEMPDVKIRNKPLKNPNVEDYIRMFRFISMIYEVEVLPLHIYYTDSRQTISICYVLSKIYDNYETQRFKTLGECLRAQLDSISDLEYYCREVRKNNFPSEILIYEGNLYVSLLILLEEKHDFTKFVEFLADIDTTGGRQKRTSLFRFLQNLSLVDHTKNKDIGYMIGVLDLMNLKVLEGRGRLLASGK